jgi:signal transduction histidine kinase
VSELGETRLAGLVLEPNQNDIQFDFASLKFGVGEVLRYQFRLEGSDQDWSPPADQRSVNFARLAPGKYLFQVRALNSEGMLSAEPASVSFRVLAPVWRRAWFLTIACLLFALALYSLYRYRVARLVELERVRTRIATDLHDDIGGSLSQIAILSELARRKIENSDSQVAGPLSEIASVSREVVDAMSDIVWAINPKHDRLSNLAYRMRRFAGDILGACNIHLEFRAPGADLRVGADLRRQVFLIFKEAVTNIARHSGSTRAEVHFDVSGENLVLRVTDNGKGFDPASSTDGNGLFNIRKRAADLGGTAELESVPDRGTTLTVRLPLT